MVVHGMASGERAEGKLYHTFAGHSICWPAHPREVSGELRRIPMPLFCVCRLTVPTGARGGAGGCGSGCAAREVNMAGHPEPTDPSLAQHSSDQEDVAEC